MRGAWSLVDSGFSFFPSEHARSIGDQKKIATRAIMVVALRA